MATDSITPGTPCDVGCHVLCCGPCDCGCHEEED
jgi:hypothetical protein